jgi:uncharacterized protein YbaR (Trm112 family)
MPVCTSCNIEYEEDKKFCNYCGGPLTPKAEPLSPPKKVNQADEEKSDGKLICPQCKITYEFGSSCIQCGSPLGRQTSFQEKEEPETARRTEPEKELPPVETSQEQKIEASPGKLICPTCKIIYEHGNSCIKCDSALVPQASVQPSGEPEISSGSEAEGNRLQLQTIEEQLVVETPRQKLICPSCKIIYERGESCVRCGSALVSQTPTREKEIPKPSDIEFNLSTSEPDGLEATFGPTFQPELKPKDSGRGPGATPEQPSLSSPKEQDSGVTERGKKREVRTTATSELSLEEEYLQARTPEQPVAKKSADDSDKRVTLLSKLKKDYRRICLEVGSIIIMVVAGGYLLLSVYSYLTKPKQPEPRAPISKVAVQTLPSSSSSRPPAITVAEPGESKNTEGSSSISKKAAPAPAPLPDIPKTPSAETQEIGSIKTLLENVRQSNLKKDIDLFVSCYASDFENMEGRKRATIAYWERFSYLDLSYDLKNLSLSAETAKARVEWLIKTSLRGGSQFQQNKSILDVTFRKEEGRWKIKEVKPVR